MNQTAKPKINEFKAFCRDEPTSDILKDTENHQYVVDECSLLDHIFWRKDKTYDEIAEHCTYFVCTRHGRP